MSKIPTRIYQRNGYDIASTLQGLNMQMVGYCISNAVRDYRAIELCINKRKA